MPRLALLLLLARPFLVLRLPAQSPTATLVGRVSDATGASVPGAAVRVVNTATNDRREVQSDLDGNYTVTNLTPGVYVVTAEKAGFRRLRHGGERRPQRQQQFLHRRR